MITNCNVVSWTGSWNRKRALGKTKEHQIKHRLYIITMYQYLFINYNKYTILIYYVNNRETGARVYGETFYATCSSFSVNLKVFLEIKSINKKKRNMSINSKFTVL